MTLAPAPIKHGMFIMPFHSPAKPLAQGYGEDRELMVRAEELGFAEFWIGEHHTMKYEIIVMPEIFLGRALGEAPVCRNHSQALPTPASADRDAGHESETRTA